MPKIIVTEKVTGSLSLPTIGEDIFLVQGAKYKLTDDQMSNPDILIALDYGWIAKHTSKKEKRTSKKDIPDTDDAPNKSMSFDMESQKLINKEESSKKALKEMSSDVDPVVVDSESKEKENDEDIDVNALIEKEKNKVKKATQKKAKKKSKKTTKKKAKKKIAKKSKKKTAKKSKKSNTKKIKPVGTVKNEPLVGEEPEEPDFVFKNGPDNNIPFVDQEQEEERINQVRKG